MSLSYFVSCFVLSGFVGVAATGEIEDMTITEGGKDTDNEDTDGEKNIGRFKKHTRTAESKSTSTSTQPKKRSKTA